MIAVAVVLCVVLGASGLFVGPKVLHEYRLNNACLASKALEASLVDVREIASEGSGRLIAFMGDSWAQGAELRDPMDAFPYRTVSLTGDSAYVDGKQGTGFTNPGPCKDELPQDRIDHILDLKPDVLILALGLNDAVRANRESAVSSFFDLVAARQPARVIVLSAFDPPSAEHKKVVQMSDILRVQSKIFGFEFVSTVGWADSYLEDSIHPDSRSRGRIALELASII